MNSEEELPNFNFDKIFEESEEPVAKRKKDERFASLDEGDLDELVDGAVAKSTKYATKYAVSVFKGNNNL